MYYKLTLCGNKDCEQFTDCLRGVSKPPEYMLANHTNYQGGPDCEGYIAAGDPEEDPRPGRQSL